MDVSDQPIKCFVSSWFHKRMVIVVGALSIFAGYFLFDGFFENAKPVAEANSDEVEIPAMTVRSRQLGLLGIGLTVISLLWWWLQARKHWIIYPGDRFVTPDGREITFSEVEVADFAKWNRGIAFLDCGQKGKVYVDDIQYHALNQLVGFLRSARPDLQIPRNLDRRIR